MVYFLVIMYAKSHAGPRAESGCLVCLGVEPGSLQEQPLLMASGVTMVCAQMNIDQVHEYYLSGKLILAPRASLTMREPMAASIICY